jgi:hypothetical protein
MAKEEMILLQGSFDPATLTDGELLDLVYDLVGDNELPEYQIIGVLRDLLERARTHN